MILRLLLISFLINSNFSFGQERQYHFHDSAGYDSIGRPQGYWKQITFLNYVNKDGRSNGVEGFEYGHYIDGKKTGVWEVKDTLGDLLGQRIYFGDTVEFEIQYKKGKIYSIKETKVVGIDESTLSKVRTEKITELITFKKGKIISRISYK